MPHADPIERAQYMKQYRAKNRAALLRYSIEHWHTIQKFRVNENRETRRKRRYGITNAEWDALAKEQGNLCALCRVKPPVDIDHCHATNRIHGLLCRGCNVGLGLFYDSEERLLDAIAYLKR
jgi:hypothetical protein